MADLAHVFKDVNLEKKGIRIKLHRVPTGLYREPFIVAFDKMLSDISDEAVRIRAINLYTVGNYDKLSPRSIREVSNFLDPTCKFKDTWFGVYVIMDDRENLGRRFILKDPGGKPDDLDNLNNRSLLMLPALDQKIIVWSSHQHQAGYTWERFIREFHFDVRKDTKLTAETVTDRHGRAWRRITGSFTTNAALTDTARTNMSLISSIRSYVGLPNSEVYARVKPWHALIIRGSISARYFRCSDTAFWAVAYYNGGAFYDTAGRFIDNWEQTDLRKVLETMFDDLEIGCVNN
jgi:hypothetical protein